MDFGNFTDTKGVSQVFLDFKCGNTLEKSQVLDLRKDFYFKIIAQD